MLVNQAINEVINTFAKYVIQQSRTKLTNANKADGDLYKSLGYYVNQQANNFKLSFEMEDYGKFQDLGVKGNDPSNLSPNTKITGQQAPNSPYRFGSKKSGLNFKDFVKRMSIFAKQKNIRFREFKIVDGKKKSTGRYAKGGFDAVGYIIASNIYNRGIKPSMFFTEPFNKAFKRLPDDLLKAYSVGIENQITIKLNEK